MPLSMRLRNVPKPAFAGLLIAAGVIGRILFAGAANVEPVLILSMLAGVLLGGLYVIVVPVAILGISDVFFYTVVYGSTYSPVSILGLGLFMYTGYVFVAAVGGFAIRRRVLWRTKTIAIFTAISVPLTVAYDAWTAFGDWLFITSRVGWTLPQVYAAQVPFTAIHVFSSLLFAPILGVTFLAIHLYGLPVVGPAEAPAESQ
ncbi:MAG: hypothetical protein E6K18_03675 [Methanobacteriota archaeon]|nr:MAG: hypothetical protein E6K18_03675 [Euryarchaeota archaeon]